MFLRYEVDKNFHALIDYKYTDAMFSNTFVRLLNASMAGSLVKRTYSSTRYTKISSQVKKKKKSSDVTSSASLSPEQLQRINTNKMRLTSDQFLTDDIGDSWRTALNKEFGKDYFKSVRRFQVTDPRTVTQTFKPFTALYEHMKI